ncbi:putative hydrophobic protein (TIGR00271 family) [Pseudonocardia hierapolitana]|uniref:Putative hydrophobic protein (TIGR00271 family) n=1 Tax=Pseudonocardia hierapolitana TaxID=1128676 RepID=A0A561SJK9_9PSEU|nr:DUF389 domain-containing protein [Pseudonocardia hierapolitana]TWF75061.1 putative hydrophobic protein (TIGR00271 family) [Pseudonocardia hierapolitana]
MLHLRVYGHADSLTGIGGDLEDRGAARNVAVAPGVRAGYVLLSAEVFAESADAVLELLVRSGVAQEDIKLARIDEIGPIKPGRTAGSLIWADVLGQARANSRPVARYLVFLVAAGVIAGFGVIEASGILIVGAMAVSPDLLPITAACVGLASRRGRLVLRALATLAIGMGAACLAAGVLSKCLGLLGVLPPGFVVGEAVVAGLTTINVSTVGVALAAGVAGMLALETRASAAVGVGISITTIPAAAYLGVAAGVGEASKALGALAVLGTNVAVLVAAGTLTLVVQRWLAADGNAVRLRRVLRSGS